MKFRKKVEVVDAVKWDGTQESFAKIQALIGVRAIVLWHKHPPRLSVDVPGERRTVSVGDIIMLKPDGSADTMQPPRFAMLYEPITGQPAEPDIEVSLPKPTGNLAFAAEPPKVPADLNKLIDEALDQRTQEFQKLHVATQGGIDSLAIKKMVDDAVKQAMTAAPKPEAKKKGRPPKNV